MVNINLPFFISLSRLFFFFFPFLIFLFLFLRSCVYIIMCFLSVFFPLPFGNMFYNILIFQHVTEKFHFFFKKRVIYICVLLSNALLLHPLSGTRAAMVWHSGRNGVRTLSFFYSLAFVSIRFQPWKKKIEKKTSGFIWKITNKVLTFASAFWKEWKLEKKRSLNRFT